MKNISVFVEEQEYKLSAFYHLYKFAVEDNVNTSELVSNASLLHLSLDDEVRIRAVSGLISSVVSLLGVLGNVLSILVLSRRKMRSPISAFLIGLAIADSVFVSCGSLVWNIPSVISFFDPSEGRVQNAYSKLTALATPYLFPIAVTGQMASICFTVAVTTERYIAVCHPFRARLGTLSWTKAWLIVMGIFTTSIVFNIGHWLEYDVTPIHDSHTLEVTGYIPVAKWIISDFYYNLLYRFVAYVVLLNIIPTITLSILNIKIYRKIRSANEKRQSLSSSQQHENSLARMLVIIVGIFIFCNLIPLVEIVLLLSLSLQESVVELECIRNFLLMFNSSINFVIYCFFGEKFRDVFLEMVPGMLQTLCCCCCPKSEAKLHYWDGTYSEAGTSQSKRSRLSSITASIKSFRDLALPTVFTTQM